jgi:hypothetical protein
MVRHPCVSDQHAHPAITTTLTRTRSEYHSTNTFESPEQCLGRHPPIRVHAEGVVVDVDQCAHGSLPPSCAKRGKRRQV